jgi:hypothetical protein
MANITQIEGYIHCGDPGATHILSKKFKITVEPFPGLSIIVPGKHEIIVDRVIIDIREDLTGTLYVKFKNDIHQGSEKLVQSLIEDGWHEVNGDEEK